MSVIRTLRRHAAAVRDRLPVPVPWGAWRDTRERAAALEALAGAACEPAGEASYAGFVFSKDRALQVHALARAYLRHVAPPRPPLTLLYRASTPDHATAYAEAIEELREAGGAGFLTAVEEPPDGFRASLLRLVASLTASRVFCLVDDDLFIRPLDFRVFDALDLRAFVPSLRLGRHITRSYTQDRMHGLPAFLDAPAPGLLAWRWRDGDAAWGYPLSLDGNVFDRREFLAMLGVLAFRGPNGLESGLQRAFGPWLGLRRGACFEQARLLNAPWNRVQDEIANRCGREDESALLARWQAGEQVSVEALDDLPADAVHVEVAPRFVRRAGR